MIPRPALHFVHLTPFSALRVTFRSISAHGTNPRHLTKLPLATKGQATSMSSVAKAKSLDDLVLTVKDLDATVKFYEQILGMQHEAFASPANPGVQRHALKFGTQKINLHLSGKEWDPKAQNVQPGSGDLCFLVEDRVDDVLERLMAKGLHVLEGGVVVDRIGAQGHLRSVYIRDPDGNLIE